jgi:hypothetical protein
VGEVTAPRLDPARATPTEIASAIGEVLDSEPYQSAARAASGYTAHMINPAVPGRARHGRVRPRQRPDPHAVSPKLASPAAPGMVPNRQPPRIAATHWRSVRDAVTKGVLRVTLNPRFDRPNDGCSAAG